MKITFKDGHEIEFKRFGNILLADSVIWENTCLHGSLDELRKLKAKIADWFAKNAPDEISDKFTARLTQLKDVKALPFKDQIAYKEGKTDQIAEYFLGDEDNACPVIRGVSVACIHGVCGLFDCVTRDDWSALRAVRLCLEEKQ